jgi:hypothetical protein
MFKIYGSEMFFENFGTNLFYLDGLKKFFLTMQNKIFPGKSWYFEKIRCY